MPLSYSEARLYSDRKIFSTLVALMVVALVATAAFLYCLGNVLRLRQESIQITKVQTLLDGYFIQLLNAETGQRGFLVAGDEAYLAPYTEAVGKLPAQEKQLVKLSRPYPYHDQVTTVQTLAGARMEVLRQGIEARRGQGPEAAAAVIRAGQGNQYMDQLRSILVDISRQQATGLATKRTLATAYGDWAVWISIIMAAGVIALAGLVYYLFLKAIQSERALDRAKDEFVSLASHQLRTPATGLKSILSMLQAGDFGRLNTQQQHMVGRAIESNEREIRIVDELLNVARADAGRLVLKPAELDLSHVVDSIAGEQRVSVEAKQQYLEVRGTQQPVIVVADEEKLRMAIGNLIDNASKYTPNAGHIQVTLKRQGRAVRVEVTDTGIGIDKAEQAVIFDRFQRAHGILMSGVEGTGLGLYLARRIAELHNGTIEVKSKKGRGSTFTLKLNPGGTHHVT